MPAGKKFDLFSCQGFTLLEVMISVSIIALVFVSLFRMQGKTIELVESGKFYAIAPMLAETALGNIRIKTRGKWTTGTTSGDFTGVYAGCSWRCHITEPNLDDMKDLPFDGRGLKKIHITIFRNGKHQNHGTQNKDKQFYEVSTFRYPDV